MAFQPPCTIAETKDPFADAFGRTRGPIITPAAEPGQAPTGPALMTVHPELDFEQLAEATATRWHDRARSFLAAIGVRSTHSEHLCHDRHPSRDGYAVHLRAHQHASYTLCAHTDEYGEWHPKATEMLGAPRGSFREPELAPRLRGGKPWLACKPCLWAFEDDAQDRDRDDIRPDMKERAAYPMLPKSRRKPFRALLADAIRSAPTPTPTAQLSAGELQALCDGSFRRALAQETVAFAYAQRDDAFTRLLGRELWHRLPHTRASNMRVALPMAYSKFLPAADFARIVSSLVPDGPDTPVDWKELSATARSRTVQRIKRLLALRELEANGEDW